MKRLFFVFFCFLALGMASDAKDLNPDQKELQSSMFSFLKTEGFSPEIDSDGDIKFTKSGVIYWIVISDVDESPLYVSLQCNYTYGDGFSRERVESLLGYLSYYKGVKLLCFEDTYSLRAELYLTDADYLASVFYTLMNQIDAMRKDLVESCNKEDSKPAGAGLDRSRDVRELLSQWAEEARLEMPMDLGDGMIMVDCFLSGENFGYRYEVEEDMLGNMELLWGDSQTRDSFVDLMLNVLPVDILRHVADAGANLVLVMEGKESGRVKELTIPNEDIADHVRESDNSD